MKSDEWSFTWDRYSAPFAAVTWEQLKHKSANREDGTHLDIVVDDFFDVQVLTLLHKAISTYPYS